jgi:hypothetical protein
MDEQLIDLNEAKLRVEGKVYPKVTEGSIRAKINRAEYHVVDTLTVCILQMENGFYVVGKAAPADFRNYDPDVGKRFAYEDAFKQLWHLEGYLLKEKTFREVQGA